MMPCLGAHFLGPCTICMWAPGHRGELRSTFNLADEILGDCPLWCCCGACANCQETRELKQRNVTDFTFYSSSVEARKMQGAEAEGMAA